jgi:hypothetical protein
MPWMKRLAVGAAAANEDPRRGGELGNDTSTREGKPTQAANDGGTALLHRAGAAICLRRSEGYPSRKAAKRRDDSASGLCCLLSKSPEAWQWYDPSPMGQLRSASRDGGGCTDHLPAIGRGRAETRDDLSTLTHMADGARRGSAPLTRELHFFKDVTASLTLILKDRHFLTSRRFSEFRTTDQQERSYDAFPSEQW